jgi:hypothetical protein
MNTQPDLTVTAARAGITAAALDLGKSVDRWSLALMIVALLSLLWLPLSLSVRLAIVLSIMAALVQKIFAMRVAFDQSLFKSWADKWNADARAGREMATHLADMAALDRALTESGLVAKMEEMRDLNSRSQGAMRLLKKQLGVFAFQLLAIGVAVTLQL